MSEPINPYQAPPGESLGEASKPVPSACIPQRLSFQGCVTRQMHRRAVTRAGIRTDYLTTRMIVFAIVTFVALVFLAVALISGNVTAGGRLSAFLAAALMVIGIWLFQFHHQFLIAKHIPDYQFVVGEIHGWLDPNDLVIESDDFRFVCPVDQMVGSACDGTLWAITFHKTCTFWQTLGIAMFDDPQLARAVAGDLQHLYPAQKPQLFDARVLQPPEQEFRWTAGAEAVHYAGSLYQDAAHGSQLIKVTRRVARRSWLLLGLMFCCLVVGISFLTGLDWGYFIVLCLWMFVVIAAIYFNLWKARRKSMSEGRVALWYSKGWLDEWGYTSMTTLGQMQMRWSFIDHFEITEDAILLYPHEFDACACLVGRSQFSDQESWDRACQIVLQGMQTPPVANAGR